MPRLLNADSKLLNSVQIHSLDNKKHVFVFNIDPVSNFFNFIYLTLIVFQINLKATGKVIMTRNPIQYNFYLKKNTNFE